MRLLIVEDEVKIARALSKVFTSEGYAVDIEHDSTAGYAMASTEPYDGLIIDRMLPGEYDDGVAMLQALRKAGISTPALARPSRKQKAWMLVPTTTLPSHSL